MVWCMTATHSRAGAFRRVGENLYRYSSSGVYYARFRTKGKEIQRSLKTCDRELAKRRLQEEITKASKVDFKLGKLTLRELLGLYEESVKQFAPKTIGTRRGILNVFKRTWSHGLEIAVNSLSTGQLDLWLASQRARVKNATYNEYARFLRQLFDIAVKHRALAVSPAASIRGLKIETPIRLTPTWEQFRAVVEAIRSNKNNSQAAESGDLVEFMGLAGVGRIECSNLRGEHINFVSSRITLYRVKTDTGYSIPIFPQLLPLLRQMETNGRIKAGQPLFQLKDPKKALASACKRLKYPHFSSRALRRCFITRSIELGVDFKTIAAWQGHRDGGVLVARTYSHLRNEHSENMAKKLAG